MILKDLEEVQNSSSVGEEIPLKGLIRRHFGIQKVQLIFIDPAFSLIFRFQVLLEFRNFIVHPYNDVGYVIYFKFQIIVLRYFILSSFCIFSNRLIILRVMR